MYVYTANIMFVGREVSISRFQVVCMYACMYECVNMYVSTVYTIGYREIAEQLLLAGCKVGILNQDLKVAANLATSSYLSELIRNPNLIKDKQKYQNSILRNILETKRRAATSSLNIGSCRENIVEFETDAVKPDMYGGIAAGVSEKSNQG